MARGEELEHLPALPWMAAILDGRVEARDVFEGLDLNPLAAAVTMRCWYRGRPFESERLEGKL